MQTHELAWLTPPGNTELTRGLWRETEVGRWSKRKNWDDKLGVVCQGNSPMPCNFYMKVIDSAWRKVLFGNLRRSEIKEFFQSMVKTASILITLAPHSTCQALTFVNKLTATPIISPLTQKCPPSISSLSHLSAPLSVYSQLLLTYQLNRNVSLPWFSE